MGIRALAKPQDHVDIEKKNKHIMKGVPK